MLKNEIKEFLYNYTFKEIIEQYPERLKDNALNIIITNLKLRNPKHRKNKVKIEDIIREIFADGLIKKDIENKKIEAAIKLAKGEITEEEAEKIFNIE